MTVNFKLSKQSYINCSFYRIRTSKYFKRTSLFLSLCFSFIILLYFVFFNFFTSFLANLIIGIIFSSLALVFFPKYHRYMSMKSVVKQINEGSVESLIGDAVVTLNEETIDYTLRNGVSTVNGSYKYSSVERIGIDYNCIFIYLSSISAIIIPFLAFENNKQKDEFLKLVSEKSSVAVLN